MFGFVPALVTFAPEAAGKQRDPQDDGMEVVIANGRRVVVGPEVDVAALVRLVRGLDQS